jgi:RNA polymerase primary sigma factor
MEAQVISIPEPVSGRNEDAAERGGTDRNGRGDPNLSLYFHDLASHPLLSQEEEAGTARRIQSLETAEWAAVFSHPPIHRVVIDHLRVALNGSMPVEVRAVRGFLRWYRVGKGRLPARRSAQLRLAAERLGRKLRDLDCDRLLLNAAQDLIASFPAMNGSCPRALRRIVHTDRYAVYLDRVRQATRATAREKERFILANLRLVISVARRYQRGRMPLIDMIQEGNIGLMKAVERFDVRKGYRFSTYASWWIRHAINRALADKGRAIRIPVHMLDTHQRIERAFSSYASRRGHDPTDSEIAVEVGLDCEKVWAVRAQSFDPPLSLDRPLGDEEGRRFVDVIPDEEAGDPLRDVCTSDWQVELGRLLDKLPAIEASILRWRFGLGDEDELTLKEIGDRFQLSRERIRQLQEQALVRMRRNIRGPY